MGHEDTFAAALAHIYFPTSKNDFLAPRSIAPSLPLSLQETTSAFENTTSEEEREAWAFQSALNKFASEQEDNNDDGLRARLGRQVLSDLNALLTTTDFMEFKESADELLRQSTVLCWGALEVLASDLFVILLNEEPVRTSLLFNNSRTKTFYQSREFGTALQEHDYDLSGCMGEILIRQRRLDDVCTIRSVFNVLFPANDNVRATLARDLLWSLSQDRNLIVHRRARLDKQYVANVSSILAVGSTLRISPTQFEEYLIYVRDAGCSLLTLPTS